MEERGHKELALDEMPLHRVLHGQRGSRKRDQPPRHQQALPPQEFTTPPRPDSEIMKDLAKLLTEQMVAQSERWGILLERL